MMKSFKRRGDLAATRQIKAWTRARFRLSPEETVFIAEVECGLPGCPPRETVVAFWTAPDRRHSFKVFKPIDAVVEEDLPPSWMKDALVGDETADCC